VPVGDLVLSSHLLITYADLLDAGFHLAALLEPARVGREACVYPLVDQDGRPLPCDYAASRGSGMRISVPSGR
jgi:hypothetical protein